MAARRGGTGDRSRGDRIETETHRFRVDGIEGTRITGLVVTETNA